MASSSTSPRRLTAHLPVLSARARGTRRPRPEPVGELHRRDVSMRYILTIGTAAAPRQDGPRHPPGGAPERPSGGGCAGLKASRGTAYWSGRTARGGVAPADDEEIEDRGTAYRCLRGPALPRAASRCRGRYGTARARGVPRVRRRDSVAAAPPPLPGLPARG